MSINLKRLMISFVLIVCSVLTIFSSCFVQVNAQETVKEYSNVLTDLSKDETFTLDDYPTIENDYSLKVIQIAESVDKELFVYVYQPLADVSILATSINISTSTTGEPSYNNYSLLLLNRENSLFKYKVLNFTLPSENERVYEISSIFRKFNEEFDSKTNDIIDEVSFSVGIKFVVRTMSDGSIEYINSNVEVINITDKYCGFVRYTGGFQLLGHPTACDSWFVAFNTDKNIDKLIEASVYYVEQTRIHGIVTSPSAMVYDYLVPEEINETNINEFSKISELSYTQKGEFEGTGWWAPKYTWDRITATEKFIKNENRQDIFELGIINVKQETKLTDTGLQNISDKKWVLRFAETDYKVDNTTASSITTHSIISNVSILRLKFESLGKVYNLGVVDNKQSSDDKPINDTTTSVEINPTFLKILKIIFIIAILSALIALCAPILPYIGNVIVWLLKAIITAICFVLSIPIKLVRKIKESKSKKKTNHNNRASVSVDDDKIKIDYS